jgi:hypothetical protein
MTDEKRVLQRYEDANVRFLKVSCDREMKHLVFEATEEFHDAWVELERLTPKIGKLDQRYLDLIDRVEKRIRGDGK